MLSRYVKTEKLSTLYVDFILCTYNKAVADCRLRPRCTADEYLIFIAEQNLVGIDGVISAVMNAGDSQPTWPLAAEVRGPKSEGTKAQFRALPVIGPAGRLSRLTGKV